MNESILSQLAEATEELVGATVPRPSGQLAGHAGGLPFEILLEAKLEERFPGRAYRHFNALNAHLLNLSHDGKNNTSEALRFGSDTVHFLVSRGKKATKNWSPENQFKEKQNDTSESIIFSETNKFFDSSWISLIDVKSQRTDKNAQPPNIISAKKIKGLAEKALTANTPINFEILYAGVQFTPEAENGLEVLRCVKTRCIDLMKVTPSSLYINWAAATQIQFHPASVNQDFNGTKRDWFVEFLHTYADSLEKRLTKEHKDVEKIRKFLDQVQS